MPQTTQNKTGVLAASNNINFNSYFPLGDKPVGTVHYHGRKYRINGNYGNKSFTSTSLGGATGALESTPVGQTPADFGNWKLNNTSGNLNTITVDPVRGKVLTGVQGSGFPNSDITLLFPQTIPEKTHMYMGHWGKVNATLGGVIYPYLMQCKYHRLNNNNTRSPALPNVMDNSDCDWKWFQFNQFGSLSIVNNGSTTTRTRPVVPALDNTWYYMESFIYTGTQGLADGSYMSRVTHNGETQVVDNNTTVMMYGSTARYSQYIEQYYLGNFNGRVTGFKVDITNLLANHTYSVSYQNKELDLPTFTVSYTSGGTVPTKTQIFNALIAASHPYLKASIDGDGVLYFEGLDPTSITFDTYGSTSDNANMTVVNDTQVSGPNPDVREVWRDDNVVVVGNNINDGWQRVELRDTLDETTCTVREQQSCAPWSASSGIDIVWNMGGISPGTHTLYLCVIDGFDANGKDIIVHSEQVTVRV